MIPKTLQRKFAVLLCSLGLIVLINLGTAAWSIWFLERELSGPLASIEPVLTRLFTVKRAFATQAALVANEPGVGPDLEDPPPEGGPEYGTPEERRVLFETTTARIADRLDSLEAIETYRIRAGQSSARNLRTRSEAAAEAARRWIRTGAPDAAREARDAYAELYELVERIEGGVILNARMDVAFGGELRARILAVLGSSLLLMLLAGALGIVLVRRLVVRPVGVLRDAAARLATGDFTHRIPVTGEDELAMLSAEVNHMAATIASMQEERVDRERLAAVGEMVRRLAHNLRNPLSGIRSLAELTRSEMDPDAPARENQERIIKTVDRFEAWLSELLSATTPLRVDPRPTAVAEWLGSVLETLRPMAGAKGVTIDLDATRAPAKAPLDPRHLEQALVAVVTNAIQASPRGSQVEVSAADCGDGEFWEIRVRDHGPGVPQEQSERVFRPYFTTKRDGTGIGLAVARQVVEQHGGRIWVEPAVPAGSGTEDGQSGANFMIRLPIRANNEVANIGQLGTGVGGSIGQNPDHRGRRKPAVFNPAGPESGRS